MRRNSRAVVGWVLLGVGWLLWTVGVFWFYDPLFGEPLPGWADVFYEEWRDLPREVSLGAHLYCYFAPLVGLILIAALLQATLRPWPDEPTALEKILDPVQVEPEEPPGDGGGRGLSDPLEGMPQGRGGRSDPPAP